VDEHYLIPDPWIRSATTTGTTLPLFADETHQLLSHPVTRIRSTPFAIYYPYRQIHTIDVLLYKPWSIQNEQHLIEDDAFTFKADINYNRERLTLQYEYESITDHVQPERIAGYLQKVNEASELLGYQLYDFENGPIAINWSLFILALLVAGISIYFAKKVYYFQPSGSPLSPEKRDPRYHGFGGWLILVGIGLLIRPFILLSACIVLFQATGPDQWNALTNPASEVYHPMHALLLIFEITANTALLVFAILMGVLFIKRSFSFPKVYSIYLLVSIGVVILDTVFAGLLPTVEVTASEYAADVRDIIVSLIWIAYFQKSKRVETTFVHRLNEDPEYVSAVVTDA
jgi:hypothetical protein